MDTCAGSQSASPWVPQAVQVGDWKVTALSDGFFRLDGGAMWGVVPATLWRPMTPPAEDNTIRLALRPFLLERGDLRVVIEGGVGNRWSEKLRAIYHIDHSTSLEATLRACGVTPEEVTHVIASHCHWDHIGSFVIEEAGELQPLFSQARHFLPRAEFEMAKHPDHARRGSYRAEDVEALETAGLVDLFDSAERGDIELVDGIRARHVGGHSEGVCVISINELATGPTAVFWADVIPTTHHIQPPYIMAYDVDVLVSFEQRSRLLEEAADKAWIGLFYHDADTAFGRVVSEGRRYSLQSVDLLPPQEKLP